MSLKKHLAEGDVIVSIRRQLEHPSGANKVWILVEGETDQKLFSKLINGQNIVLEIAHGGLNSLLRAVAELLTETDRVIGIRDADFLHLEGKTEIAKNVFLTDFHDTEMMLIACDKTYHSVAAEYLHEEKEPYHLRQKVLASIAFIGGLRWLNDSDILELNFQGIGFGNFYDGQTASLDEEKCLNVIIQRSPNRKGEISKENVWSKINTVTDFFNLCNGHDFLKALALCINYNSKKGVNDVAVGQAFRVAYQDVDFQKSNLYRQLKEFSDRQAVCLFKQD